MAPKVPERVTEYRYWPLRDAAHWKYIEVGSTADHVTPLSLEIYNPPGDDALEYADPITILPFELLAMFNHGNVSDFTATNPTP